MMQYDVSVYVDDTVSSDKTGKMLLKQLLSDVFAIAV